MPRTPEQYQAIRKEKKRIIMEAALELFANDGYHATSISNIARKANISKGLLYNYFKSKEHLLEEIAKKGFEEVYMNLDSTRDGILTEAEFVSFIDKLIEGVILNRQFWKLYYSLMLQPGVMELLMKYFKEMFENFNHFFFTYFSNQEYEKPMDETIFFSAVTEGALMQYLFSPLEYDLTLIKKKLIMLYAPNFAKENNVN